MRALVTGSNGFIGSFLVEKLLKEGYFVRCLVRRTSNIQWLEDLNVEFCYADLTDPSTLTTAVRDMDIVYHLAGVTRGLSEHDFIAGNVTATKNLLQACTSFAPPQQKFVFVSSQAAGGPSLHEELLTEDDASKPISLYGHSKLMAEHTVLAFAQQRAVTIIRPSSVYGPRDIDFFKLFKGTRYGFLPMVGSGKQKISIIYIADLIEGLYSAGTKMEANGQVFFMSSDDIVTFSELALAISSAMGARTHLINVPLSFVKIITLFSSLISTLTKRPSIINRAKFEEIKQPAWLCSNEKAKQLLDFRPRTGLADGLHMTASWYRKNGWL